MQMLMLQVEEGWWEGSLNGKTGVFPSNFVEMIEEGDGEQPGVCVCISVCSFDLNLCGQL